LWIVKLFEKAGLFALLLFFYEKISFCAINKVKMPKKA
jgi:hypothetical protein